MVKGIKTLILLKYLRILSDEHFPKVYFTKSEDFSFSNDYCVLNKSSYMFS